MTDPQDRHLAGQARLVAIVIAATMVLWMGAQLLGGALGWPAFLAFMAIFYLMVAKPA